MELHISKSNRAHRCIGILIGLSSILIIAMLLCPTIITPVKAWTNDADEATARSNIQTSARLWNKPTIAVALADTINLEVTPKSTGTFVASTANLTVETNSTNGLRVLMNAVSGSDLTSTDGNITQSIKPLTSQSTQANFDNNTWGYYVGSAAVNDATPYAPVPTTATEVLATETSGARENYNVAFGAKVDSNLPSGVYSNSVLFSVVANPIAVTMDSINYMQEMQPGICDATATGFTKQLIDTRDNQKYWVSKLRDGRCWMVQNLNLDISLNSDGTSNIKAIDSDVTADWNTSSTYPPTKTESIPASTPTSTSSTTTYSWDVGNYVITNPSISAGCGDIPELTNCNNLTNVNGWSPTYTATSTSAIDTSSRSYDPHYSLGNYYQWNTATAGTGGTITSSDTTSSICAKGWTLPTQSLEDGVLSSFRLLLAQYGITGYVTGTDIDGKTYNIVQPPLYFVRGGLYGAGDHKFWGTGTEGFYWSSRANDTQEYGFPLDFNDTWVIYPPQNTLRRDGYSVRCINKTN